MAGHVRTVRRGRPVKAVAKVSAAARSGPGNFVPAYMFRGPTVTIS
jgi:hypothetical protein